MTSVDLALRPHFDFRSEPVFRGSLRFSIFDFRFSIFDFRSVTGTLACRLVHDRHGSVTAKVGQAFLPILPYERQRKVTGPSIGCAIGAPVRRDAIKFAFSAKYHFAGRSASSININRGLCFNPSACWIIVF